MKLHARSGWRFNVAVPVLLSEAILFSLGIAAGESSGKSSKDVSVEEKPTESLWSGDLGVNFVSAYFAFGILQENQGVIVEPYVDISQTLFRGDGAINKLTLGLQLWSSMHSAETGADKNSSVPWWYEFDYYVPIGITIANEWTVTASYLDYEFPGGAFNAQRGVQANVSFDDSKILGGFALHPRALILYNFQGILGIGQSNAWYGEVGVTPTTTVGPKHCAITLTFPLLAGFGDAHFYPGASYGYFSATANGSVPLRALSRLLASWSINAGFTYYNLGQATADLNANRDRNAYVLQIGLGRSF